MTRADRADRRAGRVRGAALRPPTPCATSRAPRATSSRRASGAPSRTPTARRRPTRPPSRRACTTASRRSSTTSRTSDLNRYFKSEKLGTKGQGPLKREPVPRKGVRIIRDRFNVPHIYGKTNDDVTWGAGWALAHDRELLLEQARYNARVAVVDAPGLTAIDLIVGLKTFEPSAQTEREVQKEVDKLKRYGKPARRLLHDIDLFVKGINAYYRKAKAEPQALDAARRDRPQRRQERAVRRGRRRRGPVVGAARRPAGLARRHARAVGLERPAPAPGPRDARLDPRQLPLRAAPEDPQRQPGRRQRLVPAGAHAGRRRRPGRQRDAAATPATC